VVVASLTVATIWLCAPMAAEMDGLPTPAEPDQDETADQAGERKGSS
jgi:hypothetical protein